MSRKIRILIFIITTTAASFQSIHAKGGIGLAVGQPSGVTLRFNQFPVITVGYYLTDFNKGTGMIYGSIDYWIFKKPISGQFQWYLGLGGNVALVSNFVGLGLRVPVGILWVPTNLIEVFLEGAPGIMVFPGVGFAWQAALGIRFMVF
jgi:hypothetical protein